MKVLHISTSDFGGAGLCALRICQSLRYLGIDSEMLVARKATDLPFVHLVKESGINTYTPPKNRLLRKFQKVLRRRGCCLTTLERYQREVTCLQDKAVYTYPLSKYDLANHPLVKEADIIHLHWVSNFVDFPTFFSGIDKPIVWTLHDENIGYGGFHYQKARDKYYSLCKTTEDELLEIKQSALSHAKNRIYPVAISELMESFCTRVPSLEGRPVTLIHNGINADNFIPIDRDVARQIFGIPDRHLVFAFCAQSLRDPRKGLKELISALEKMKMDNVTLICAGDEELPQKTTEINVVRTGAIVNERMMSLFYSSADYFVLPSFEESFGQTPLEAMACGIPVIAFPCGVTKELINETNGVRCEDFTVDALVDGIKMVMGRKYDGGIIRNDVIGRFSYDRIGRQYKELYNKVLNKEI